MDLKFVYGALLQLILLAPVALLAGDKVVVDGKANEWSSPLRYSKTGSGMSYDITNDSGKLYFVLQSSDQATVVKLLNCGFQIYIDTAGKKRKSTSITFPMRNDEMMQTGGKHHENRHLDERAHVGVQHRLNTMEISGFRGVENGIVELPNNAGVQGIAVVEAGNVLTIEMAIPFRFIKVVTDTNTEWSIGMRLNAPPRPEGTPMPNINVQSNAPGADMRGSVAGTGGASDGGMGNSTANYPRSIQAQGQGTGGMDDQQIDDTQKVSGLPFDSAFFNPIEWRFKIKLVSAQQ